MRIAVLGAGGVGGYLGGLLARAGDEVALIARGEHLRVLRERGLTVHSTWGDFAVRPQATDRPEDVGPVDLVLFTVKTYHNAQALPLLRPLVGEGTTVLTLQNGVESHLELGEALGPQRVLPGAIYIETRLEAPGVVRQQGTICRVVVGEADGSVTPRAERVAEALRAAGVATEVSTDITKTLWTKWLFICTLAGVTAASRARAHEVMAVAASRALVERVLREMEAVGRALGVALDVDVVELTLQYMEREARHMKASMHSDLEAGRPLELEALTGAAVRLGRQAGVPTPVSETLYALLKPHDLKHRGELGAQPGRPA